VCVSRFHVRNHRSRRLYEFLFKMKLEQPENLQGGVIEGPPLAGWLYSPIYARQTAHSDERPVVGRRVR